MVRFSFTAQARYNKPAIDVGENVKDHAAYHRRYEELVKQVDVINQWEGLRVGFIVT
jgi:predicted urease superfamily metal-dependent hydrolase